MSTPSFGLRKTMGCSLFTYGTLEIPKVMEAVTGRLFPSTSAMVEDFARFLLKGRIYPGMTATSGQTTSGRVYFEVDDHSLSLLDRFEDDLYVRQSILIRTDDAHWLNADAYIIEPKDKKVLSADAWVKEKFVTEHLGAYLGACRAFHCTANRSLDIHSSNF